MKTLITLAFILASALSVAQKPVLPDVVKTNFDIKYPESKLDDWWFENDQYHVNYTYHPYSYTAVFDTLGNWQETSELISDFDIPAGMKNYLREKYPSGTISYCEKVETKDDLRFIRVNFYDKNQFIIFQCDNAGRKITRLDPQN